MKTRQSLVSNSSSSSFVLIGIPIQISELTNDHVILDDNAPLKTIIIGSWCCEGKDVFSLREPGQLAFIKEYPQLFEYAYIHARTLYEGANFKFKEIFQEYKMIFGDGCLEQLDKLEITGGTADQNSSYSTKIMLENYEEMAAKESLEKEKSKFRKKWGVNED